MRRVLLAAALAAACAVPALPAAGALAAAAPAHESPAVRMTHGTRLAQSARGMPGLRTVRSAGVPRFHRLLVPSGATPAQAPRGAAAASPAAAGLGAGAKLHAFNGLSSLDVTNVNQFTQPVTPPDQGLCVGRDPSLSGHPQAVWEPINLAARETSPAGTPLRPDVTLATLFQDPFAEGDVRCLFDPATQSFYFTEIGFPVATGPIADLNNTTVDVTVMNARGVASYQFDTSQGQNCFGDQPKVGFDNNALIVSTDQFCDPNEDDFEGALVVAISKPQLVAEAATVNSAVLGPVSLAGDPVVGLDPAIGTGLGTEFFVNSVPFNADGSNDAVGTTLGLWTLTNDRSVTTGIGTPQLASKVLSSENYAFPVDPASTGDGTTTTVDGTAVTSEAALDAGDSRLSGPVSVARVPGGGIRLWTALDAAVTSSTDGAAWFQIDPVRQRIVTQGMTATPGANLLYPAVAVPRVGAPAMVFTITSAAINPSAAFTRIGSGVITTDAAGAGPHVSFSDNPPFNSPRWGDYSFAQADPDGSGVWLATEYIPPAADQNAQDNWGTFVTEVPSR